MINVSCGPEALRWAFDAVEGVGNFDVCGALRQAEMARVSGLRDVLFEDKFGDHQRDVVGAAVADSGNKYRLLRNGDVVLVGRSATDISRCKAEMAGFEIV